MTRKQVITLFAFIIGIILISLFALNNGDSTPASPLPDNNGDNSTVSFVPSVSEEDIYASNTPFHPDLVERMTCHEVKNVGLSANEALFTTDGMSFAYKIHPEDIVQISLPLQPDNIDITKIKAIGVAREYMHDPYVTPLSAYTRTLFETSFREKDGKITAEAMIGYGQDVTYVIDILIIYGSQITNYATFNVDHDIRLTDAYFAYAYPDKTVHKFAIQCGTETLEYFYFEDSKDITFTKLIDSGFAGSWSLRGQYAVNNRLTWRIPIEQCNVIATPGAVLVADPTTPEENPEISEPDEPEISEGTTSLEVSEESSGNPDVSINE